MSEYIETRLEDGVLRVRFNRPEKKNAITIEMYEALIAAFDKAASDDAVRVLLLEGSDDIFSAGNDLSSFAAPRPTDGDGKVASHRLMEAAATAPKPLVAAVSGGAVGIGATLLLHFDFIYADETAFFLMPFTDLATVPEAGASLILPQRFGRQIAAEFLLLSDRITAQRAYDMGLVNAVVRDGNVRGHAFAVAQRLAQKPPMAMKMTKALMTGDTKPMLAHIDEEMRQFAERVASDEMQQIVAQRMMKK